MDEIDYVVLTAGSFDLLLEVVCEDDDHLLEILSRVAGYRPSRQPRLRLSEATQADLHLGDTVTLSSDELQAAA